MDQPELGSIEKSTKLDQFSREELITKYTSLEDEYHRAIREIYRLKNQHLSESQLNLALQEHLQELNQNIYGASSERYKKHHEVLDNGQLLREMCDVIGVEPSEVKKY